MDRGDHTDAIDAPIQVRAMVGAFLREVDEAAPGLVQAFHLTGSVALGDYRPGISDIDFLAVTSRLADNDDLTLIAEIHRAMPKAPRLDGIYLDRHVLASTPDDGEVVPHSAEGEFHTDRPCGELNPVLWLALNQCGVTVRGASARELPVPDPDRIRTWCLGNLRSYWSPLAATMRQKMAGHNGDRPARSDGVMWAVLGPARLHYTLATGRVTSKTDAGRYAVEQFPTWHELAELAVACREGGPVTFTVSDALTAADMVDAVVDDAWRRWG